MRELEKQRSFTKLRKSKRKTRIGLAISVSIATLIKPAGALIVSATLGMKSDRVGIIGCRGRGTAAAMAFGSPKLSRKQSLRGVTCWAAAPPNRGFDFAGC